MDLKEHLGEITTWERAAACGRRWAGLRGVRLQGSTPPPWSLGGDCSSGGAFRPLGRPGGCSVLDAKRLSYVVRYLRRPRTMFISHASGASGATCVDDAAWHLLGFAASNGFRLSSTGGRHLCLVVRLHGALTAFLRLRARFFDHKGKTVRTDDDLAACIEDLDVAVTMRLARKRRASGEEPDGSNQSGSNCRSP